jgi:hypothetical protein
MPFGERSRLRALLDHFSEIEDPREAWKVAHPLPEALSLVVCGTIADCDDYEHIAAWGDAHLGFLREILPYHHGVPGGRWLTLELPWKRREPSETATRIRRPHEDNAQGVLISLRRSGRPRMTVPADAVLTPRSQPPKRIGPAERRLATRTSVA